MEPLLRCACRTASGTADVVFQVAHSPAGTLIVLKTSEQR